MSEQEKHYDLEPGDRSDPLRSELESQGSEPPRHGGDVHELDVCPSCGASMRGEDQLVCLRCGFDLKTMRPIETQTLEESVDEPGDDHTQDSRQALCQPGRGDVWMPGAVAAISALLLIIGCAGGVAGLFPGTDELNFGIRLLAVLQLLVRLLVWTGCVLGGLWCTAHLLNQQPLGDLKLAAVRSLAAVSLINLVRFLNLNHDTWELGVELVLQAGLLPPILMALFGINIRDAGWATLLAGAGLLAMVIAPLIVGWSM